MKYNYLIRAVGFPTIGCRGVLVAELLIMCFKTGVVIRTESH